MNILILFAHPETKSFNGALRDTVQHFFEKNKHEVRVRDLVAMNFKATVSKHDFGVSDDDFFDLQMHERNAAMQGGYPADVQEEMQHLLWADVVVMQFPLWWYSIPAILKGYIDRVFATGFAYGGGQALAGKHVMLSTTTGAPEMAWTAETRGTIEQIFMPLSKGTFPLIGMKQLPMFVSYSPKRMDDTERKTELERFEAHLGGIFKK